VAIVWASIMGGLILVATVDQIVSHDSGKKKKERGPPSLLFSSLLSSSSS